MGSIEHKKISCAETDDRMDLLGGSNSSGQRWMSLPLHQAQHHHKYKVYQSPHNLILDSLGNLTTALFRNNDPMLEHWCYEVFEIVDSLFTLSLSIRV
jgi:hypothetical protein